jgi:hypothetical protein
MPQGAKEQLDALGRSLLPPPLLGGAWFPLAFGRALGLEGYRLTPLRHSAGLSPDFPRSIPSLGRDPKT